MEEKQYKAQTISIWYSSYFYTISRI